MLALTKRIVRERIEQAILRFADDYREDGAFFICNEADAQCRLYGLIQDQLHDHQLVHSEWGEGEPRGYYDLVVWRPSKKIAAYNCWGDSHEHMMEKVPDLLLAAIEIDCLYGGRGKAGHFATYKKLESNPDIRKLIENTRKSFPYGYLLLLWDEEAEEKYPTDLAKVDHKCLGLLKKYGIRSICFSREPNNIKFKHGFSA